MSGRPIITPVEARAALVAGQALPEGLHVGGSLDLDA